MSVPRTFLIMFGAAVVLLASSQGPAQAAPGNAGSAVSPISVASLSVDGTPHPLGIDDATPRLGWVLRSADRAQSQSAYEVRVATSVRELAGNAGWDSGKVTSRDSVSVAYRGPELQPSTRYFWQVRVWDAQQRASAWSAPGWWETGVMGSSNWSGAEWIGGSLSPAPPRWPAGTRAVASSTHANIGFGPYDAALAIDDDTTTFWNDNTQGQFPDVLTITSPTPVALPGITVTSYAGAYIDGYTVDTLDGSSWVRQGAVTGAAAATTQLRFANSVTTTAVRISVTGTHAANDFSRIVEVYPGLYDPPGSCPCAAPELRKDFTIAKPVASARLYISAAGYDEPYLNGQRVGNHVLDPGFTDYNKRVQYVTYDVTSDIRQGANTVGAVLGRGFYGLTTPDVWKWNNAPWHGEPRMLAKLAITYTDGSQTAVVSDGSWQTHSSPTVTDSVYLGETYDARAETPGWATSAFDAASWSPATVRAAPTANVVAETQPPITEQQVITATAISNPKPGVYVYKFPYVTSGWARLRVSGPRGTDVALKFGERLNGDGTVNNDNSFVTGQMQTDHYILSGAGTETWTPRFSWDGFQYIQVDGYPGTPDLDAVKAVSLHSDLASVGAFSSSNPLLNELHAMARRTVLNNAYGILTDTPEYEKNGWMDDAQLIAPTVTDNFGMDAFYAKWLEDMQDSQAPSGQLSVISPDDGWGLGVSDPEWQAAFFIVPWQVYQSYGDASVLAAHYAAMKRYLDYMTGTHPSLVFTSGNGDWCSPDSPGCMPPEGTQESATAFVDLDAQLLSKIAAVLGHAADADHYAQLADQITGVINTRFRDPSTGGYHGENPAPGRQTPDVLALALGIVPADQAERTVADLVANVHAANDHLNTGTMGLKYLLPTLTEHGHADLAYKIATETSYPSLGYMASFGTGTLWEGWDQNARSHDHYMFGSYDHWFYSDLAGIQPTAPGYATIRIRPYAPRGLREVSASIDTVRGAVASHWSTGDDGTFTLDATVPVNATAEVDVPATSQWSVAESGHLAAQSPGVHFDRMDGDRAVFSVASGSYHFRVVPHLGTAINDAVDFAGTIGSLHDSGALTDTQASYLDQVSTDLVDQLHAAAAAAAADAARDADTPAADLVDAALHQAADTRSWVWAQHNTGDLNTGTAATLDHILASLSTDLSESSAVLRAVQVNAETPTGPIAAGSSAHVVVTVHNAGPSTLHDVTVGLHLPAGWPTPAPPSETPLDIAPGHTLTVPFDIAVPLATPAGSAQLTATASYRVTSGTVQLRRPATLPVTPAIEVTDAISGQTAFQPQQPASLSFTIANHADEELRGTVAVSADSGWTVTPASADLDLAPGARTRLQLAVTPPAGPSPGHGDVHVRADYATLDAGQSGATDATIRVGDLARGAPATALHSLQAGPWGVANLTDGQRTSTSADEGYTSDPYATTPTEHEWVQVDLGAPSTIGSVTLYPRTHTPADGATPTDGIHFPADFTVQVSDDGTSWTTTRTVTGQSNPGTDPQTYALHDASGRYLRIDVTNLGAEIPNDFYRLQLAELEANGASIR